MMNYRIENIRKKIGNEGIAGYYVIDTDLTDVTMQNCTWISRGNGLEVYDQGVTGPFKTRVAAEKYAKK